MRSDTRSEGERDSRTGAEASTKTAEVRFRELEGELEMQTPARIGGFPSVGHPSAHSPSWQPTPLNRPSVLVTSFTLHCAAQVQGQHSCSQRQGPIRQAQLVGASQPWLALNVALLLLLQLATLCGRNPATGGRIWLRRRPITWSPFHCGDGNSSAFAATGHALA